MTISASRTDKAFHLLDYSLIIARNETKEGLAHTFSSVETLEISQWFNTYPKCQSVLRLLLEVTISYYFSIVTTFYKTIFYRLAIGTSTLYRTKS